MKTFRSYLHELCRETLFLIIFILGLGSTIVTYLPTTDKLINLKRIGYPCMLISFIGANYRVYKKNCRKKNRAILRNLIDEFENNNKTIQVMAYTTPSILQDEVWKDVFSHQLDEVPDQLRSKINEFYKNVRGAKEIHLCLQRMPLRPDGTSLNAEPELTKMYALLEDAKSRIMDIINDLKEINKNYFSNLSAARDAQKAARP